MKKQSVNFTCLTSLLCLTLFTASCDTRPIPGEVSDSSSGKSDQGPSQVIPKDSGPGEECVRWKGFCFSSEDCPDSFTCEGCESDPCCPPCGVCAGTCTPAGPGPEACNANEDCHSTSEGNDFVPPSESFCNLDKICISSGFLGTCEARPTSCPFYAHCPTVCGCDGLPYCSECDAHKAGVSVSVLGGCPSPPVSCEQLNNVYKKTVQSARTCCAMCDYDSCKVKVFEHLNTGCPCPCEIYISEDAQVLQQLKALELQWVTLGCGQGFDQPMTCCAAYPACETPSSGYCSPAGVGGLCTTMY